MTSSGTRSMLPDKPLLMIMDGHALVRRAYHGMREPLNVRATDEEVTAVLETVAVSFQPRRHNTAGRRYLQHHGGAHLEYGEHNLRPNSNLHD